MTRIAVGGLLHETNTFAPSKAVPAIFCGGSPGLPTCDAPGAMPADPAGLPRTCLRPGIGIEPNGPAFVPPHKSRSSSSATG